MGLKEKAIGIVLRHFGGKGGKAVWAWLNGKKMVLGLTCEALGHVLEAAVPYIEPVFSAWGFSAQATAKAVQLVGQIVTGLGAAHKFTKAL